MAVESIADYGEITTDKMLQCVFVCVCYLSQTSIPARPERERKEEERKGEKEGRNMEREREREIENGDKVSKTLTAANQKESYFIHLPILIIWLSSLIYLCLFLFTLFSLCRDKK